MVVLARVPDWTQFVTVVQLTGVGFLTNVERIQHLPLCEVLFIRLSAELLFNCGAASHRIFLPPAVTQLEKQLSDFVVEKQLGLDIKFLLISRRSKLALMLNGVN